MQLKYITNIDYMYMQGWNFVENLRGQVGS